MLDVTGISAFKVRQDKLRHTSVGFSLWIKPSALQDDCLSSVATKGKIQFKIPWPACDVSSIECEVDFLVVVVVVGAAVTVVFNGPSVHTTRYQ